MWRMMGVLVAMVALATLTLSHGGVSTASAGDKQFLCHATGKAGAHIIDVSVNAVPGHLKHGDCLINSTDASLIGDQCDLTDANGNDICDIQP